MSRSWGQKWQQRQDKWADRSGAGDSAKRTVGPGDTKKGPAGDDCEQESYNVVTAAAVMEADKADLMEVEEQKEEEKGAGKGDGKGTEATMKKFGKEYPCAECGKEYGHRRMIVSKRLKHGSVKELAPETVDGPHKQTVVYLKICASCELVERRAAGDTQITL
jgi:hypothetical protein